MICAGAIRGQQYEKKHSISVAFIRIFRMDGVLEYKNSGGYNMDILTRRPIHIATNRYCDDIRKLLFLQSGAKSIQASDREVSPCYWKTLLSGSDSVCAGANSGNAMIQKNKSMCTVV